MDLIDDRAHLDAYRRGDRAALGKVFDDYAPRVSGWLTRGFAFSSGGDRQRFAGFRSAADVHDTLHEVFRRAFETKARHGYSGLKPFEGYLFVITRNCVLARLGKRSAQISAPETFDAMPSENPSPEESVARAEERQRVQDFLATLSDDERHFTELRFVERRAQVDVADALGLTRKKVRLMETAIRGALVRHLLRARGSLELEEALHEGSR